jgi:hypothetical protein
VDGLLSPEQGAADPHRTAPPDPGDHGPILEADRALGEDLTHAAAGGLQDRRVERQVGGVLEHGLHSTAATGQPEEEQQAAEQEGQVREVHPDVHGAFRSVMWRTVGVAA